MSPEMLAALPVFPLPGMVFFPNSLLPLHIFEPRYRAMTAWCLANRWPMAVGRLVPGEAGDEPKVESIVGAGFIRRHQKLPDGRYTIVLEGVARVELLKELAPVDGYRRFETRLVVDVDEPSPGTMDSVRACVATLAQVWEPAQQLLPEILEQPDPSAVGDMLASMVFTDPAERQALLAEASLRVRLDRVVDRLADLVATGGPS